MTCNIKLDHWITTEEGRVKYWEWFRAMPESLQRIAVACPPFIPCYLGDDGGHYKIVMYAAAIDGSDKATLGIEHGGNSSLPGAIIIGMSEKKLTPCGCGEWIRPTPDQTQATADHVASTLGDENPTIH